MQLLLGSCAEEKAEDLSSGLVVLRSCVRVLCGCEFTSEHDQYEQYLPHLARKLLLRADEVTTRHLSYGFIFSVTSATMFTSVKTSLGDKTLPDVQLKLSIPRLMSSQHIQRPSEYC